MGVTAVVVTIRADVTAELERAAADLRAAIDIWQTMATTTDTIDREYDLLDKAFRAGALDVGARAQFGRRLVEASQRLDAALRDLRVARAQWARRTSE